MKHDRAYWRGGSALDRLEADIEMMRCVYKIGHHIMALVMFIGVRIGGYWLWPTPWRWGYGYKYPYRYNKINKY